ncbi:MAG: hypothetical protein R3F61_19975 [Myxococcota bacterium]
MLALDALLMNSDRHEGNIIVQAADTGVGVNLWAIDFALSAAVLEERASQCRPPDVSRHARGLPVRDLAVHARSTAQTLRHLSNSILEHVIRQACRYDFEREAETVTRGLRVRCENAPAITEAYLDLLGERG